MLKSDASQRRPPPVRTPAARPAAARSSSRSCATPGQASIDKWTEFAKEGGAGRSRRRPKRCASCSHPQRWSGTGAGVFDAGLRQVLEGPKYATLWDLDRKLLELQQLATAARQGRRRVPGGACRRRWNNAFERFSKELASPKDEAAADLARPDRPVARGRQRHADRGASHRRVRRGAAAACCARRPTTGCRNARSPRPGARRCTSRRAPRWTRCSATVTELRRQLRALQRAGLGADARCRPTSHARQEARPRVQPAPSTRVPEPRNRSPA